MILILDTNAFVQAKYSLTSPSFQLVPIGVKSMELNLVIPEVVILEVERRLAEDLAEARNRAEAEISSFKQLYPDCKVELPAREALSENCKTFGATFRAWRKDQMCAEPKMATISVESLVRRDLDRNPPFDKRGAGMRDAILWEAVLEEGSKDYDDITLVSADGVFWNQNGDSLDPRLLDELRSRGFQKQVRIFRTLKEFVSQEIRPHLKRIRVEEIESGDTEQFDQYSIFFNHEEEIRARLREDAQDIFPPEFGDPYVVNEFEPEDVEVLEVLSLENDLVEVRLRASAEITISGVAHESDVFLLQAKWGISASPLKDDDELFWVESTPSVEVVVSVSLQAESLVESGFGVEEINWDFGDEEETAEEEVTEKPDDLDGAVYSEGTN
jgi:hypothetical protein